ncbi:hypothetical protein AMTR_s00022p00088470 [Amborella trichopoda]|uniref:UVR domain-containing protein n=2 Tax=Amborella trichopoda TaxID=13333 RepID=W1PVZ2_AMBTC|nr:hypothetical protein AMTR_s00022p00088470 [Amborella trichopoda]
METELEEACESEDFERAERVSESLAAAEKAKEAALTSLREAEAECDSVDLRMQEVLESQVAAEEEGVLLLQQFAKDASENADIIMKDAEELSSKEMEEWLSKMECLEMKKMELDLESHLIDEARSGLSNSIDQLTEIDRKEKELLQQKRNSLLKDLENLLELVRLKEAEIAKNNSHIQEVDRRIVNVVSEFHVSHPKINVKYDELQSSLSELSSQSEVLTKKKKEVDDFLCLAEENRLKLSEIASMAAGEARACEELVGLRKALASSILKSRDDKLRLAKTEEKISEEIQLLRQEVSAARASLQELSSSRASIQQEITSSNQRLSFVDQRIPDLEAEKKVAATARNFKEAGRISAESKALSLERETIQARVEEASSELDKMEEEIQNTIEKLHEKEVLVLSKEREAAMSRCERLRLVAASSMVEREAALELGDIEEAESLFAEAKAADSEASELLQTFNLEGEKFEKVSKHLVSMAVITSLAGKQLAEKAISIQPSLSS